jgi:hypothetical protein
MKRVGMIQSSYIPWKGFFDLIDRCDEFLLLDEVQYTRRDWRNRNRIKTATGTRWLTIPVVVKGRYHQRIDEVEIDGGGWADKHLRTIAQEYAGAAHAEEGLGWIRDLYARAGELSMLTEVNELFLTEICARLGIETTLRRSTEYRSSGESTERLATLCEAAGATEYLSGPAARDYLDEGRFERAGIAVSYMDYGGYPEYPQPHPPFEHAVTILDPILALGDEAADYVLRGEHRCPTT